MAVIAPMTAPTTGNIAIESFSGGGSSLRTKGTGSCVRKRKATRNAAKGLKPPRYALRGSNPSFMLRAGPESGDDVRRN